MKREAMFVYERVGRRFASVEIAASVCSADIVECLHFKEFRDHRADEPVEKSAHSRYRGTWK